MIHDLKPPLDEDLLIHFGIRGMKWGHRKARDSGGSGSSASPKKPMSVKNKTILAGVGVGLAVGGAATAYILAKRGGVKVPSGTVGRIESALGRYPARNVKPLLNVPHVPPSPFQMRLAVGQAAQRNAMTRIGTQKLTDKAWRDSARLSLLRKDMDTTTQSLLETTRRNMDDPNYVWRL